jgi:BASS family bile acid:Na+ symporter
MDNGSVITQIFLPLSLAFIMFSVGLELVIEDFKRVVIRPRDFIVGAISQIIFLPLVAFGLLSIWSIEPALAVGVMIIAACPGGVTSNLMTYLARGDTALSVSLTAIISLLAVVTLPVIVSFSIIYFMDAASAPEISIGKTVLGVFAITTVPVIMGMVVKRLAPAFARNFERTAKIIASVLFVVIIAGAIFAERSNVVDYFRQAGPVTLSLNLVMMTLALSMAKILKLGAPQKTAITLECGLQNGTLAIFVAVTLIGSETMMVPGAIYSLLMFPTALAFVFIVARRSPDQELVN